MRIKVCGLCRQEDVNLAFSLGAWALGFVFYEKSPRFMNASEVKEICSEIPHDFKKVGVFVHEDLGRIEDICLEAGLSGVQLHGDESPQECEALRKRIKNIEIIKAFRLNEKKDLLRINPYLEFMDFFLVDAAVLGKWGGTGQLSSWDWAKEAQKYLQKSSQIPLILSGGLGPKNIRQAHESLEPFALDLSSGVESHPRAKNPSMLKSLFQKALP